VLELVASSLAGLDDDLIEYIAGLVTDDDSSSGDELAEQISEFLVSSEFVASPEEGLQKAGDLWQHLLEAGAVKERKKKQPTILRKKKTKTTTTTTSPPPTTTTSPPTTTAKKKNTFTFTFKGRRRRPRCRCCC